MPREERSVREHWLNAICQECEDNLVDYIRHSFRRVANRLSDFDEAIFAEFSHADRLAGKSGSSRSAPPTVHRGD
jgi:hypothetical protein